MAGGSGSTGASGTMGGMRAPTGGADQAARLAAYGAGGGNSYNSGAPSFSMGGDPAAGGAQQNAQSSLQNMAMGGDQNQMSALQQMRTQNFGNQPQNQLMAMRQANGMGNSFGQNSQSQMMPMGMMRRSPFSPQQFANPAYAAPRSIQNFQPQVMPNINQGAAQSQAQQSEIDRLRSEMEVMRNQTLNAAGGSGWNSK